MGAHLSTFTSTWIIYWLFKTLVNSAFKELMIKWLWASSNNPLEVNEYLLIHSQVEYN